jgi:UDP-glucose 4-epimerase
VIKGSPEKRWSFIHFSDLAEGYLRIAESPIKVIENEIFNFGDHTNASLNEIIEKLKKIVGKDQPIEYREKENDFWGNLCECDCVFDCKKANILLGWYPKHNFYDGLEKYYKAWKANN